MTLAQRMIVMNAGRAEQIGAPLEVYAKPGHHLRRELHRLAADEPDPAGARRQQVLFGVRPEHLEPCAESEAKLVRRGRPDRAARRRHAGLRPSVDGNARSSRPPAGLAARAPASCRCATTRRTRTTSTRRAARAHATDEVRRGHRRRRPQRPGCACYLAKAGLKVKVLERRGVVGGAAVTEEFHPGFRNSVAAYTVSLLQPKVIRDLRLAEHGLRIVERPLSNFLPLSTDGYLKVGGGLEATQARGRALLARATPSACRLLGDARARRRRAARRWCCETPPNVGGGVRRSLARFCRRGRLKRLDMEARRDLLGLFTTQRRRLAGRLVRVRRRSRRRSASMRWSATTPARITRARLRAAAPLLRRSERQARRLGPRHRRHGRDHPGAGRGSAAARRARSTAMRRSREVSSRTAARRRALEDGGEIARARASSPTSIRSCCS